ncbi:MAG: helix-turn-helix transcriptional regulator, partial [Eubacteriales bacterium]|nr:helix-turn-helix transcriptional regulator [Eubacteriales bacterium]
MGATSKPKNPNDDLSTELGQRIRALRQSKKMRILDLANQTSLTSSMISQVERAGISPSIETLKKIGNALNVPVSYFFEEKNDDQDLANDLSEASVQDSGKNSELTASS